MTTLLIEAALRSLLLALAVGTALALFRVRNVLAEKAAWILVLAAALMMPLMLVLAARWPGLPLPKLVLPAMAMRAPAAEAPDKTAPARAIPPRAAPMPAGSSRPDAAAFVAGQGVTAGVHRGPRSQEGNAGGRHEYLSRPLDPAASVVANSDSPASAIDVEQRIESAGGFTVAALARSSIATLRTLPLSAWAAGIYLLIAFALCLRPLLGLAVTLRVWRAADPVEVPATEGAHVRASDQISTPVTIGSGVLLPAAYAAWGEEKLRIVLAHERSHVRQWDFYLQLLASLYAALLWLSPLGWWLKHKLSDLGEAIGDRSGLEEAHSRTAYARVLLEFAAAPRPTMLGVAMARPSSLSRRMERLLNESAFRQAFSSRGRAFAAALLLPAIFFAAAALVRVEAAATSTAPASLKAPSTARAAEAPVTAPHATSNDATDVSADVDGADAVHADSDVDATPVAQSEPFAAPVIRAEEANEQQTSASEGVQRTIVLNSRADDSSSSQRAMAFNLVGNIVVGRGVGHALVMSSGEAAEGTFDRTLTINGQLELHVTTGSGNIHLTRGTANQVVIHGHVHSSKAEDADEVRALAANPPIQQEGNVIHIGVQNEERRTNHISIDYEIQAPADANLAAETGSGNIVDEGVGHGSKLETGSGNITASGLTGGFKTETGSGNITVENAGEGDAKAETGSGTIDVKGVQGGLKADTGSGDIKVEGKPTSPWKLETGSGSVELMAGSAPMTLDASTGSGRVTSDHPMGLQTSSDGHKISGSLNGGGPLVVIETGSGDVRVHN
jgi:beta-lactamase regulating signal transducer with metallopeptidase domain